MPTVRLTWTDLNNGPAQEDEVRVYRSLSSFDEASLPAVLATLAADTVTYDDTTAATDTTYYYAVAAVRGSTLAVSFTGAVDVGTPPAGAGAIEHFLAKNSTTQSHTASATTEIVFGTEVYDTYGVFASDRFTVPLAMNGYYAMLFASVTYTFGTNSGVFLVIQRSTDAGSSWTSLCQQSAYGENGLNAVIQTKLATDEIYRAVLLSSESATISSSDLVNFGGIILEPVP